MPDKNVKLSNKQYHKTRTRSTMGETGYRPHVIVKFKDEFQLPYKDGVDAMIRKLRPGLWESIVKTFPGIRIKRLFTAAKPEEIKELEDRARASEIKQGYHPPNLHSYFVIYTPPKVSPLSLAKKLSSIDIVETAYLDPPYDDASITLNPDNNPYFPEQGYLKAAPVGINAIFAWTVAGGDGKGQRLIDLEKGWVLKHEDLKCHRAKILHGSIYNLSRPHGTGVLGICCACDNKKGCIGIAPHVDSVSVVSHYNSTLPDALLAAILKLDFGHVLLVEVQTSGTSPHRHPVEIFQANFDMIELATAVGIVVIEAAGNEGVDLDNYKSGGNPILRRSDPSFKDSGAIMVGAATSASRARWTYQDESGIWHGSNYGSRIDCYAWGENIWTTWFNPSKPEMKYVSCFDGTSGAAAIIAGASLSLQGMVQAKTGSRYSPSQVRNTLRSTSTGTRSGNLYDKIGVMPNLKAIVPTI